MGCCHSDLKGDKPGDANNDPAPQPIKKVQTNFSTVDYDATTSGRRDTIVGPDETPRQRSEALSPLQEKPSNPMDSVVADGAVKPAATSTGGDRMSFENRLLGSQAQASTQDPLVKGQADGGHVQPYRDVTEEATTSPTEPTTMGDKLPPSQVPDIATNKQGEKPTYIQ